MLNIRDVKYSESGHTYEYHIIWGMCVRMSYHTYVCDHTHHTCSHAWCYNESGHTYEYHRIWEICKSCVCVNTHTHTHTHATNHLVVWRFKEITISDISHTYEYHIKIWGICVMLKWIRTHIRSSCVWMLHHTYVWCFFRVCPDSLRVCVCVHTHTHTQRIRTQIRTHTHTQNIRTHTHTQWFKHTHTQTHTHTHAGHT